MQSKKFSLELSQRQNILCTCKGIRPHRNQPTDTTRSLLIHEAPVLYFTAIASLSAGNDLAAITEATGLRSVEKAIDQAFEQHGIARLLNAQQILTSSEK